MTDSALPDRIRSIDVWVPEGSSGRLEHDATFVYAYPPDSPPEREISITMPVRTRSYERGALFPVFEMNIPEGYVRRYIADVMRKQIRVNEMLFLAMAGRSGIGRLAYRTGHVPASTDGTESLADIIGAHGEGYFQTLVDRYLVRTTAGVPGVQPKVLVPETRGSLVLPGLIVKSAGIDHPLLAVNEYICMDIARNAGLSVPEFWLSADEQRFVMRRFDIDARGQRLGMEDFSVLMARPGDLKYRGSYENMFKAARLYDIEPAPLFEQLVLSVLVGNGDAHLKNFAVLYRSTQNTPWLSPVFDVVCTAPYEDYSMALSLDGSRAFPDRATLERFAQRLGIPTPANVIDRVADAAVRVLADEPARSCPMIRRAIEKSLAGAARRVRMRERR